MSESSRPKAPAFVKVVLISVILFLYIPLLLMVTKAFRLEGEASGWTLQWFQDLFQDQDLLQSLKTSLVVGIQSSFFATILGTTAAIALHHGKFRGRQTLQFLSVTSLVLPEIVFALALLIWFYIFKIPLGLSTVIISHITFSTAYVILTLSGRLSIMDHSFEEAGADLGASNLQVLFKITLPLLLPSIFSAFLLSFLISFDDFVITFFVNGVGTDTLPIKLYTSMKMGLTPKLNALATLMWASTLTLICALFRTQDFWKTIKR